MDKFFEILFLDEMYSYIGAGLKKDELVVHTNFGIGRFRGLKNLSNTECFLIEYDNGELLYVPVNSLSQITPYVGIKDISLDSLSKKKWKEKSNKSRNQRNQDFSNSQTKEKSHAGHPH